MLVRLTTGLSGPAYSLSSGDERDFPQDEALRLIAAGYAVPVAEVKTEKAVKQRPAAEVRHPLDHDGDGRKGGSLPKSRRAKKG